MQVVLDIAELPESSLSASAAFYGEHLDTAIKALANSDTSSLVIALPVAGPDHDDWRRTMSRDLARAHAPKRVNVVGCNNDKAKNELLAYLEGASGVTGQYLAEHE